MDRPVTARDPPESLALHEAVKAGEVCREAGEYQDMDASQARDTLVTERLGSQTPGRHQTGVEVLDEVKVLDEVEVLEEVETLEEVAALEEVVATPGERPPGQVVKNRRSDVEELCSDKRIYSTLSGEARTVEEYEDMDRFPRRSHGCEQPEYQNLPLSRLEEAQETGSVCSSFDNPDYWHSRLFLKADAIRT